MRARDALLALLCAGALLCALAGAAAGLAALVEAALSLVRPA